MVLTPMMYLTGGLGVALLATVAVEEIRLGLIRGERNRLEMAITDPDTGYIARLTTANNNTEVCVASLADQNKRIEDLGKEQIRIGQEIERVQKLAMDERARLQTRIAAIQAVKPQISGDACVNTLQAVLNVLPGNTGQGAAHAP